MCKELLDGIQIYDIKFILILSIGVIIGGFAIMAVNSILWLKYMLIGIAIVMAVVKRDTIMNYLKKFCKKIDKEHMRMKGIIKDFI